MTKGKRFHFGYVCGDTGLIDEEADPKWFIENCCNINDLKKNWISICDKLNELADEIERLNNKLYEEQLRTIPLMLNTHISEDDFEKIEKMIIKYFGKCGGDSE